MKSIDKSVRILEALVQTNGARVSELSDRLEIPSSTVHAHLDALKEHGLVRSNGDINSIGLKCLYFSGSLLYDDDIYPLIEPKVTYLARETGERAQFISEQDGQAVYLFAKAIGDTAVKTDVRPGKFVDLHATAAGKAILAHMPEARVNEIIDYHGLTSYTAQTITDRESLFRELETVRKRGYAINDEERITKQRAVGAPVLNTVNEPVGAFSVSGPAHRINNGALREVIPNLLLGVTDEVALNIQYS